MRQKRVDVVIPAYNYGRFLRACVASVCVQQGVDVRVLILDDCSSDETPAVGSQLASTDSRIEYRRHAANRGHVETYNEGLLDWADGDYCLLLSADDMLAPGALQRAVALMEANPAVGLVYGDAPKTATPEQLFSRANASAPYDVTVFTSEEFLNRICAVAWNIVPTPTAVVRTGVQKAIGGYRAELPHSGDMEMWLRCGAHAAVGLVHGEQAYYRVHREQMSLGYTGIRDYYEVKLAFDGFFDSCGARLCDPRRLQQTANRALAMRAFWDAAEMFERGDLVGCRTYLDVAIEICPDIRRENAWKRLEYKRALGPRLWSIVRPIVRRDARHDR